MSVPEIPNQIGGARDCRPLNCSQVIHKKLSKVNPLTYARNGQMQLESRSRLSGNRLFEHTRPRNEPGQTENRCPGIRNDSRSSRNHLESIVRPKNNNKKQKKTRKTLKSQKSPHSYPHMGGLWYFKERVLEDASLEN